MLSLNIWLGTYFVLIVFISVNLEYFLYFYIYGEYRNIPHACEVFCDFSSHTDTCQKFFVHISAPKRIFYKT